MIDYKLLTIIASSSLLSAILTAIVNYRITSKNYRNEYYKKLLDKRLEAYEDIYNFLLQLKTQIHDKEDGTMTPYILASGMENLERVIIGFLVPMKKSIWMSNEISFLLSKLNTTLLKIEGEARKEDNVDKELLRIGFDYLDELRQIRKDIEKQIKIDFRMMHDISSFISR